MGEKPPPILKASLELVPKFELAVSMTLFRMVKSWLGAPCLPKSLFPFENNSMPWPTFLMTLSVMVTKATVVLGLAPKPADPSLGSEGHGLAPLVALYPAVLHDVAVDGDVRGVFEFEEILDVPYGAGEGGILLVPGQPLGKEVVCKGDVVVDGSRAGFVGSM